MQSSLCLILQHWLTFLNIYAVKLWLYKILVQWVSLNSGMICRSNLALKMLSIKGYTGGSPPPQPRLQNHYLPAFYQMFGLSYISENLLPTLCCFQSCLPTQFFTVFLPLTVSLCMNANHVNLLIKKYLIPSTQIYLKVLSQHLLINTVLHSINS